MVFGIGEGKVIITLPKTIFSAGEIIRGKAKLEMSAPRQARSLRLDLCRVEHRTSTHTNSRGLRQNSSHNEEVVEFTKPLSGEKMYGGGEEYEFELVAPAGKPTLNLPSSPVSGIITALASFATPAPRYFIKVSLDMPMAVDVSGKVQIQIQPAAQPAAQQQAVPPSQ